MRFGRIDSSGDEPPTPRELDDCIDDRFSTRKEKTVVEGEDPIPLKEKGTDSWHCDDYENHSFCQFKYIADTENSARVRDGDVMKDAPDDRPVNPRVFYFKNGQFAYESQNKLNDGWVPQFILRRIGRETELETETDIPFSQKTMREFYWDCKKITLFRFGSTDEKCNTSSDVVAALDELAETVSTQEFSGGNPPKNLKNLEMFDEAAENMRIHRLRGKKDGECTTEILSDGMKQIEWDESDWPANGKRKRRAKTIYRKIAPYLRKLE